METNYTPPNEMPERPMYKVLAGQHALVTGASKGLGAGAAIALATAGTDVLVNYRSDRDGADTVVKEITAMGRRAFSFKADVSQEHEVLAMFADNGLPQVLFPLAAVDHRITPSGTSPPRPSPGPARAV